MSNLTAWKRAALLAGKIALGSSLAIYTAEFLHLEFSSSAGIVTLLTLITTKKGTLKLSIARVVTFFLAAGIASVTFLQIQSEWMAYGTTCKTRCGSSKPYPGKPRLWWSTSGI